MKRPRLLVTNRLIGNYVNPPESEFDLLYLDSVTDRDALLRDQGPGIEAVLAAGVERFDNARLDLLPDLKLISVCAAGVGGIDLAAARARGIAVTNAGDLNAGDVADFAVTMALAQVRGLIPHDAFVRADRWPEGRPSPVNSVAARRVGVVGLGHIGRAIAERMTPFRCPIRWWGPNAKPGAPWGRMETLETLAEWCDILFISAAGNDDTRGLITAKAIHALGPNGLLVNVSRGYVVDEDALRAALQSGRLGAAGLDVFDKEPILGSEWADVPNIIMAPHVAGATKEAFAQVMAGALDNVRRHFEGRELLRRLV